MRILATSVYERRVKRLLTADARAEAETTIAARPDAWPVIAGTGGARKARIALPGRGKSGGARVIYFHYVPGAVLVLLDVYAKNTKEDLTHADKRDIKAAIGEIVAAVGSDSVR